MVGEQAGALAPTPTPPASVGFPQGEAPAAHSWCGLGGQELEKDVPPQLPRRGHRRPSEPQAGPAGPPPCPQPPQLPSASVPPGEGGEAGPHSSAQGPLPASGLLKPPSFPSGPWEPPPHPLPAGRGPSGKQGPSLPVSGDLDKETHSDRQRPPFPPTWPPCGSVSRVPTVCGLRWVPLNFS